MTVVSWGRVVLFLVWPFFLLWVECLTFYYFFFSLCCCALLPLWMECVVQTDLPLCFYFLWKFYFEANWWFDLRGTNTNLLRQRYFEGFFFSLFFACCGDGGLRATLFDPSDPPRFSGGSGRWEQRQVDHETNLNLGLKQKKGKRHSFNKLLEVKKKTTKN